MKFNGLTHDFSPKNLCYISGGSTDSSGSTASSQQSGFRDLSPEIQGVFNNLATNAGQYIGQNGTNLYTPLAQTAGETSALNSLSNGSTSITPQNLQSNIAMQMNPYDSSVINTINQQAQGQNSLLNQNASAAGQFGSNRTALGANDIDQTRLNNIGTFQQGEYNTALNNALTTIPTQNATSAQNALSAGTYQRQLQSQNQQAPITALQQVASILGVLPTQSAQGTSAGSNQSSGWNFGVFSSDERLKDNIDPMGNYNGYPLYEFSYRGNDKRYIGVMAHEVMEIMPEAVSEINGYLAVDYGMINVPLIEVN